MCHTINRRTAARPALKLALGLLALVGALYLFVYPARTYLQQRREIASLQKTISVLSSATGKLHTKYVHLEQPWYIKQVARSEYGLVEPGQVAYSVLPPASRSSAARRRGTAR